MDTVQISKYGNTKSDNYGVNSLCVSIGDITLWFSYQTVVAYQMPHQDSPVVSENLWGPTTGRHLNAIDGGVKKSRVNRGLFEAALQRALTELGIGTPSIG